MTLAYIKTLLCNEAPAAVARLGWDDTEEQDIAACWAFLSCVLVFNCIIAGTCAKA